MQLNAGRFQHHDGDAPLRRLLLKDEVTISGQKRIEPILLGQLQQLAILDATRSHALHRDGIVARQSPAQAPIQTLVNEDAHRRRFPAS